MKKAKTTKPSDPLPPSNGENITLRPWWDRDLRELWVGDILVKKFTGPAKNQELVLAAFQEIEWERLLWDPLPPVPRQEPKRRLQGVVERLKGNQRRRLLHFRVCQRSTAIVWQWAVAATVLDQAATLSA